MTFTTAIKHLRGLLALLLCLVFTVQQAAAQTSPAALPKQLPVINRTSPPAANRSKPREPLRAEERHEEGLEQVPQAEPSRTLKPFGANLFMGNFMRSREDGLNPEYIIMPGDHVALNVWGAVEVNEVFVVDGQGNIFIPQVGPVRLAGVKNGNLTDVVRQGLSRVYTRYFDVYTNLITAKPVSVFVTGGVARPGRYAGIPSDSTLFFLDQAGGIDPEFGSYRDIQILRGGQPIARIDLYEFILGGSIADPQFKDGDTILVRQRGPVVEMQGSVASPALLEFKKEKVNGAEALSMIPKAARATEVTVAGIRKGVPISRTLTVAEFRNFHLEDGDQILLRDDGRAGSILVNLEGEHEGPSVLAVQRGARLVDVLHHVAVNRSLANLDGIHLRRASVAQAQKDAIDDALFRLERSALLALSDSDGETNIRVKEADLVQNFVERARNVQPLGRVVTARGDKQLNILLEEGDTIVIPRKTNIVRVSGEVFMAQAVMYTPGTDVEYYVKQAGGYTDRANEGRVVIHRPNAQVIMGDLNTVVYPGDEILVPPKVDTKTTQLVLDITQIVYQVAVGAAFILFLVQ